MTAVPLAALALALGGCRPSTDLNKACFLIKKNPDGGSAAVTLTEAEVLAKVGRNKDFISLGSIECEDLVCVRDSNFPTDGGVFARGYCSRACEEGQACPSFDPLLDLGADKLNCRPLLLDRETLQQLDGGVGNVREPYFCARGQVPDAGI